MDIREMNKEQLVKLYWELYELVDLLRPNNVLDALTSFAVRNELMVHDTQMYARHHKDLRSRHIDMMQDVLYYWRARLVQGDRVDIRHNGETKTCRIINPSYQAVTTTFNKLLLVHVIYRAQLTPIDAENVHPVAE